MSRSAYTCPSWAAPHSSQSHSLTLKGIPTLGTLAWNPMPVSGGRFTGSTRANAQTYVATGPFGGTNQAGVVGHASGPGFQSVLYGDEQ
ncbi:MAG: hypothetical protein OXH76_12610 [Boseongicola sp.]|nr:hypothetical protein [Boseongicola sp.]